MNGLLKPEQMVPRPEQTASADFASVMEKSVEKSSEQNYSSNTVSPVNTVANELRQVMSQAPINNQQIILTKVEKILAEDMDNIFLSLDLNKQVEFKKRGEETSQAIAKLLNKATVPVKKILNLVVAWLRIIPHVNRFYLEQEAKIKTDKILQIKQQK